MAVPVLSVLSGSTDGLPIVVSGTNTAGANTVHTANANGVERVWIKASNVTALVATLTVEWGSTSDPGGHIVKGYSIPPNSGAIPISTGEAIQNSKVIKAFSGTASAINLTGYVIAQR